MPDFLTICEQAARAGGAVLLDWVERFSVREKGPADLVTEADVASQETVREILHSAFPDHDFLSEEEPTVVGQTAGTAGSAAESGRASTAAVPDRYRWIVDPLDGTTNYVHRIPEFAVSLALERGGEVLAGCVFNPVAGECYTARRGGGAYLNGRRLQASGATKLLQALVAASFPPKVEAGSRPLVDFNRVIVACQSIRRTGSAALNLCYVAAGRFDAYWARETKIWDVAAGSLLIQEAGGIITAFDGTPLRLERPQFIAAATEALHRELRAIVE
jgi:myo-inositol-1(or 4)-monophosphatase